MSKLTLLGAGLMMLVVGALHLAAPQMMMDAPGIRLNSVNHLSLLQNAAKRIGCGWSATVGGAPCRCLL